MSLDKHGELVRDMMEMLVSARKWLRWTDERYRNQFRHGADPRPLIKQITQLEEDLKK